MQLAIVQLLLIVCSSTLGQQLPTSHELLVEQLQNVIGSEAIATLKQSETGVNFLETFQSHDTWMHELLDSGPVMRGEIVIPFLFDLWSEDNSLVQNDVHRSMATACALAMGTVSYTHLRAHET